MKPRVALVGAGAWGRNLARVLREQGALACVVDRDPLVRAEWAGEIAAFPQLDDAVLDRVDAVVVATPADAHFEPARRALEAGKAVLVEKPLVGSVLEAEALLALAAARGAVGMVGHLLRFHPTVRKAVALVAEGAIGTLLSVSSQRYSTAPLGGSSAFWELLPHDLSIVHMLDEAPRGSLLRSEQAGRTEVTATLKSGAAFSVSLARGHAVKVRKLVFTGTLGSLELDDVGDPLGLTLRQRGDVSRLSVPAVEPLALEIATFLAAVRGTGPVVAPLLEGALVVGWMERAEVATALRGREGPVLRGDLRGSERVVVGEMCDPSTVWVGRRSSGRPPCPQRSARPCARQRRSGGRPGRCRTGLLRGARRNRPCCSCLPIRSHCLRDPSRGRTATWCR